MKNESPKLPVFVRLVGYWRVRNLLKLIAHKCHIQCSGKRRHGYSYEWCRFYMGHDGSCQTWNGEDFTAALGEGSNK